jgi:hypothetical protein
MSNVATVPPRVNGILETSLYVESPARSAEFYRRVFGFEPLEPGEPLNDETRLCPMRAGSSGPVHAREPCHFVAVRNPTRDTVRCRSGLDHMALPNSAFTSIVSCSELAFGSWAIYESEI